MVSSKELISEITVYTDINLVQYRFCLAHGSHANMAVENRLYLPANLRSQRNSECNVAWMEHAEFSSDHFSSSFNTMVSIGNWDLYIYHAPQKMNHHTYWKNSLNPLGYSLV